MQFLHILGGVFLPIFTKLFPFISNFWSKSRSLFYQFFPNYFQFLPIRGPKSKRGGDRSQIREEGAEALYCKGLSLHPPGRFLKDPLL